MKKRLTMLALPLLAVPLASVPFISTSCSKNEGREGKFKDYSELQKFDASAPTIKDKKSSKILMTNRCPQNFKQQIDWMIKSTRIFLHT